MKKITLEWLEEKKACRDGIEWFEGQRLRSTEKVVKQLAKEGHFDWANWVLTRILTHRQKVKYAIFSARQALEIFETKYPGNTKPRIAIEAAEAWLKNPCEETKNAAYAASYAASSAASSAASYAAFYAASAASYAAFYAASAASSAVSAAAFYAASAAYKKMEAQIIEYGINLIDIG